MKNLRFVPLGLVLLLGAGSRSVRAEAQVQGVERARLWEPLVGAARRKAVPDPA